MDYIPQYIHTVLPIVSINTHINCNDVLVNDEVLKYDLVRWWNGINYKCDAPRILTVRFKGDNDKLLCYALYNKRHNTIDYAIRRGIKNINIIYKDENLLTLACESDIDINIIKHLVQLGANINHQVYSQTPLLIACKHNNVELVKYLLTHNQDDCDNLINSEVLKASVNSIELIRYFVEEHHVPIDYQDILFKACMSNNDNYETIKYIIEHAKRTHGDVYVKFLINGEPNALDYAIDYCHQPFRVIQYLVEQGNVSSSTCSKTSLVYACQYHTVDTLRLLVERGADISICSKYDNNLLLIILDELHYHVHPIDKIKYLVEELRFDVNTCNKRSDTPLIYACDSGKGNNNLEIVQYLVNKGADINVCNIRGITPLDIACERGLYDVVEYLVSCGAKCTDLLSNACNRNYPLDRIQRLVEIYNVPVEKSSIYTAC